MSPTLSSAIFSNVIFKAIIYYTSIATNPPNTINTLGSTPFTTPTPPVTALVVPVVVVVGVPPEIILKLDPNPLTLDTDPHSLCTFDDIFSGAVLQ